MGSQTSSLASCDGCGRDFASKEKLSAHLDATCCSSKTGAKKLSSRDAKNTKLSNGIDHEKEGNQLEGGKGEEQNSATSDGVDEAKSGDDVGLDDNDADEVYEEEEDEDATSASSLSIEMVPEATDEEGDRTASATAVVIKTEHDFIDERTLLDGVPNDGSATTTTENTSNAVALRSVDNDVTFDVDRFTDVSTPASKTRKRKAPSSSRRRKNCDDQQDADWTLNCESSTDEGAESDNTHLHPAYSVRRNFTNRDLNSSATTEENGGTQALSSSNNLLTLSRPRTEATSNEGGSATRRPRRRAAEEARQSINEVAAVLKGNGNDGDEDAEVIGMKILRMN